MLVFRKLARPMLGSVYIADGVGTLVNVDAHVDGTEKVLNGIDKVVPAQYSAFVPKDAELVTRGLGAVKVVSGATLALGKAQRLSAATLALASVPNLLGRYAFWNADNATQKSERRTLFLSQIGLLGGLLITVSDTQGKPGLVWRTKHAAKVTNKKVRQALPTQSETEKLVGQVQDRAGELAGSAKAFAADGSARAGELLEASTAKADELWQDKGKDFFDEASEWAHDTFGTLQHKAASYYEEARDFIEDNRDDWLGALRDNAQAVKHKAVVAADRAGERADVAAQLASDKAGPYVKKAKKASKKAAKARKKAVKSLRKSFDV